MEIVNFNNDFKGFQNDEDIMLDTCIILALLNKFDAWHATVKTLFDTHIFKEEKTLSLYTHSGVVNEVTFLSGKPLQQYIKNHPSESFSTEYIQNTTQDTIYGVRQLIDKEVLLLLVGNKNSMLRQIDYSLYFGSMDALTISLIEEYGISLMTLDYRLVKNLEAKADEFKNVHRVYYTDSK
jgi:hypothetical protein